MSWLTTSNANQPTWSQFLLVTDKMFLLAEFVDRCLPVFFTAFVRQKRKSTKDSERTINILRKVWVGFRPFCHDHSAVTTIGLFLRWGCWQGAVLVAVVPHPHERAHYQLNEGSMQWGSSLYPLRVNHFRKLLSNQLMLHGNALPEMCLDWF